MLCCIKCLITLSSFISRFFRKHILKLEQQKCNIFQFMMLKSFLFDKKVECHSTIENNGNQHVVNFYQTSCVRFHRSPILLKNVFLYVELLQPQNTSYEICKHACQVTKDETCKQACQHTYFASNMWHWQDLGDINKVRYLSQCFLRCFWDSGLFCQNCGLRLLVLSQPKLGIQSILA